MTLVSMGHNNYRCELKCVLSDSADHICTLPEEERDRDDHKMHAIDSIL